MGNGDLGSITPLSDSPNDHHPQEETPSAA